MPPYKAERTLIVVGIETDQKTEATPDRAPGFTDGNQTPPDLEHEWLEERPVGADRDLHDQVQGQSQFEGGSWTLYPYDGWPIAFAMGSESFTTDTPTAGVNEHVLTAKQDGPPPTATAQWTYIGATGQSDMVRTFLGCYTTSFEITQDNEGIMQLNVEHEALGLPDDAPSSTFQDIRPLPDRDPWKFSDADSDLSLFGSTFAEVQEFSLSHQTGAEPQYYSESTEAPEPYEATYGMAEYSLEPTIKVVDTSLYSEMTTPTQGGFSASMSFTKQYNSDEQIDITCSGCRMESAPHDIPESGPVEVDVTIIPNTVTVTVYDSVSTAGYLA